MWTYELFGKNKKYGEAQAEDMVRDKEVMNAFDKWTDTFADFCQNGKLSRVNTRASVTLRQDISGKM